MLAKEIKEKNEVFFLFLQDALNQTLDNKKNLDEKANKLIALYVSLLTLVIAIISFYLNGEKNIIEGLGVILYLIPVFISIYFGAFLAFKVLEVKDGVLIGRPDSLKLSVYNKKKSIYYIQKDINDHYVELVNLQKDENIKNGKILKCCSQIFLKILYSIPVGLSLFFLDNIEDNNYIGSIRIGVAIIYISIFLMLLILDLKQCKGE